MVAVENRGLIDYGCRARLAAGSRPGPAGLLMSASSTPLICWRAGQVRRSTRWAAVAVQRMTAETGQDFAGLLVSRVFSVPFCTSLTARGPEVSWGTTWSPSPFMARTGTLIFFRSSVQSWRMNSETQSYWPFAPPIMP